MKIKIYITLTLCFIFACEKEVSINIDEADLIVVNSFFSPDSILKVNISKTLPVLDEKNSNFVENAEIKLYENENFIGNLKYDNKGNYYIDYKVRQNKKYKIEVQSPVDYKCVASDIIPQSPKILNIDTLSEKDYELICKLQFKDNPNTTDYYMLEVRTIAGYYIIENTNGNIDTIYYEQSIDFNYTDKIIEHKIGTNSLTYGAIFSDELINGKQKEFSIRINKYSIAKIKNNAVKFYLKNISKDFYLYAKSYAKLLDNNQDILEEPIKVYSNVQGGYGIFGAYNQSVDSIIINKEM